MKQKTAEQMRPIVEAYRQYEGDKRAFCQERGITVYMLDYWRRKFKKEQAGAGFIALEWQGSPSDQNIELYYPNGVRAIFPLGIRRELLAHLILIGG